jgi:hypothetical protein
LSPSYWIDNLGFITDGRLSAIFIKPSLGVPNWPVIFTSSTNANKFSGTIITAPSNSKHKPPFIEVLEHSPTMDQVVGLAIMEFLEVLQGLRNLQTQ